MGVDEGFGEADEGFGEADEGVGEADVVAGRGGDVVDGTLLVLNNEVVAVEREDEKLEVLLVTDIALVVAATVGVASSLKTFGVGEPSNETNVTFTGQSAACPFAASTSRAWQVIGKDC